MAHRKSLFLGIVVLLVMGALPVAAGAGPARQGAAMEPELLAALQAEGRASFFVTMANQADLSVASGMGWEARGDYVWQAVNEVARVTQAPVLDYARQHGLEARSLLAANAVYIRDGDLESARELASLPGVGRLRLERSRLLAAHVPSSPQAVTTWGLIDTHAREVWALGVRGAGAWVANIGTGVQWTHPALAGNYGCPDDPGNPRCWWDPSNICGGLPCDNNGHGTFLMGIAAAEDDPGLAYIVGMAPDATWIACKGCESSSCSDFALLSCGDWVLAPGGDPDNRPHVALNGWGGGGGDDWYRGVVSAWVSVGIVPVFTAGNSGPSCATLASPCDYPESFCATGHDESRNPTQYSGRGPGTFGHEPYTKPNISTPAKNLWSTYPTNSWINWDSTAGATAHAAGAVALAVSACPELAYDAYGLFELLQDNADPPPAGYCGAPGDDPISNYTFGYGYLNVLAAVEACMQTPAHIDRSKINGAPAARPGYYKVVFSARIRDDLGLAAVGTTVFGTWTYPDNTTHAKASVTDALGRAKFPIKEPLAGTYTFCVTDISGNGYRYDSGANTAPECQSATLP